MEREHSRELCDFGDSDSLVRLDSTQLPSKGNAIGLFVSSSVQCILLNRSWYLDFFLCVIVTACHLKAYAWAVDTVNITLSVVFANPECSFKLSANPKFLFYSE